MAADATAVRQPFTSGRCQLAQDGALRYPRTCYGARITGTAALV